MWPRQFPTAMLRPETLRYGNYNLPALDPLQRPMETLAIDSTTLDISLVAFCLFMIALLTVLGIWLRESGKERVGDVEKGDEDGVGEGDGGVGVYRDQRGGMDLEFDWERMSIEWERKYLKDAGSVIGMGMGPEGEWDGDERRFESLRGGA